MPVRIALMTSDHLRHRWVASRLSKTCELAAIVSESKPPLISKERQHPEIEDHLQQRSNTEARWFAGTPEMNAIAPVHSIQWGQATTAEVAAFVAASEPELVLLFGSSIIREPILTMFEGRIVNMHLGLSPYYRGSATNFWPLVDGKPECVGVTVHHATLKVDGGSILNQTRPNMEANDSMHDIGCRTIIAGVEALGAVAGLGADLPTGAPQSGEGKLCRRKDFSLDALRSARQNFANGMISEYLNHKAERDAAYPIVTM